MVLLLQSLEELVFSIWSVQLQKFVHLFGWLFKILFLRLFGFLRLVISFSGCGQQQQKNVLLKLSFGFYSLRFGGGPRLMTIWHANQSDVFFSFLRFGVSVFLLRPNDHMCVLDHHWFVVTWGPCLRRHQDQQMASAARFSQSKLINKFANNI